MKVQFPACLSSTPLRTRFQKLLKREIQHSADHDKLSTCSFGTRYGYRKRAKLSLGLDWQ
jgi:hypothetical protein